MKRIIVIREPLHFVVTYGGDQTGSSYADGQRQESKRYLGKASALTCALRATGWWYGRVGRRSPGIHAEVDGEHILEALPPGLISGPMRASDVSWIDTKGKEVNLLWNE